MNLSYEVVPSETVDSRIGSIKTSDEPSPEIDDGFGDYNSYPQTQVTTAEPTLRRLRGAETSSKVMRRIANRASPSEVRSEWYKGYSLSAE